MIIGMIWEPYRRRRKHKKLGKILIKKLRCQWIICNRLRLIFTTSNLK